MRLDGARVLVVDDEVALAENLEEILTEEGAVVTRAETGAEAERLVDRQFDAALLDVRLPDATGLSLLSTLKAKHEGPMEVLLITGNASLDDAIDAVRAGAYAYVLKPFDPDDLITNVEHAIDKVRLEREAAALSSALRRSENRLRTLVETVQALLLVLDQEGKVVIANKAVGATTGVDPDELVGMSWIESFVPEADRGTLHGVFDRIVGGEPNVTHENRILRREEDGTLSERWVRWRSSALRLESGDIHVYASGLDLTDQRELERRNRLVEKLAAVGTLSAGLAHEIRNPLNAAGLQLQLLERRMAKHTDDPKVSQVTQTVRSELERLSQLVEDFLAFARPTELRAEDLDVSVVIRSVVDLLQPMAEERGVELVQDAPDEPVVIKGDRDKLQQVLLNLVRNGLEAVDEGGYVEVSCAPDGAGARIVVRDDGPGIREEHMARLFEPFFSTKETGTGLGMAICHSLVSLHGGEIGVQSDDGAVFEVLLPRHPPHVPRAPRW